MLDRVILDASCPHRFNIKRLRQAARLLLNQPCSSRSARCPIFVRRAQPIIIIAATTFLSYHCLLLRRRRRLPVEKVL